MKRTKILLLHILESIERIENFTKNFSKKDFLRSDKTQDAVLRRIEIIGEAVKNIPQGFKKKHPEIEWKKIAGTRDIIVHEYFGVDLDLTYRIVKEDIPKLEKQIKDLLKQPL